MEDVCIYKDFSKCKMYLEKCDAQREKECEDRVVLLDTGEVIQRRKNWKEIEAKREEEFEGILDQNANTVIARLEQIGELSEKDRKMLIQEEKEGKNRRTVLQFLERR